jgi:hypothetical protein
MVIGRDLTRIICALLSIATAQSVSLAGTNVFPVHGLWVWSGPVVLADPQGLEHLIQFCKAETINEVYISVIQRGEMMDHYGLVQTIALLHHSQIRVAALLSSVNADEPGQHRQTLLDQIAQIAQFNQRHAEDPFDGIHLDIEPQQRAENKGAGNLRFLGDLVETYKAARAAATAAQLTIDADIGRKVLEGSVTQRKMLLTSLPRFTLMLYEPSSSTIGQASARYFQLAYAGLPEPGLATLVIGLRTADYGEQLTDMLNAVDVTNRLNPHYGGWARHSYNDTLAARGEHGRSTPAHP